MERASGCQFDLPGGKGPPFPLPQELSEKLFNHDVLVKNRKSRDLGAAS
jgi:hypothetical protein